MREKTPGSRKKKYDTPELKVYGDFQTLTGAVSTTTKNADGGTGQTNKTA